MMHSMSTLNPRITITLTPSVHALLREMSSLTGNSQSAIVAELLESSSPVFERMVSMLKAASTVQDEAKAQIVAGMDRAQAKLEVQLQLAMGTMDEAAKPLLEQAEKVRRRAARGSSTPVPVTRGSGLRKTLDSAVSEGVSTSGIVQPEGLIGQALAEIHQMGKLSARDLEKVTGRKVAKGPKRGGL